MFNHQWETDNDVLENAGWRLSYYDDTIAMIVHHLTGQIIEIIAEEPTTLDDETVQDRKNWFYGEALEQIIKRTTK